MCIIDGLLFGKLYQMEKKIKSKIEIALLVFFKAFKKQLNEHLFIRNELMKNTREVIQKVDFFKLEISI
jgi:hypothetical protein